MRVALVGVGAMGRDMARHLETAGNELIVTDVSPEARARAAADGRNVADTLEETAKAAEVFVVVVATDDQSRTVTEGILKTGKPGSVIVIAATNNPNTMRDLAEKASAAGFGFVDAPVVFGRQGAADGTLVSLCGGTEEDVERVRPVLMAYSRAVYHVGPVGAGQLAKTCNNMMHWVACVANFEMLLLAKRYGVSAQRMREILLDCPARNGTLADWDTTRFTWHEKDMDVALDLAQAGDLALPLFGQVDQLVKRLGPDQVKELLYGKEAEYLGRRVVPLDRQSGGFGE
jgi:3-hydroxyisobutyrate dehydrogenase